MTDYCIKGLFTSIRNCRKFPLLLQRMKMSTASTNTAHCKVSHVCANCFTCDTRAGLLCPPGLRAYLLLNWQRGAGSSLLRRAGQRQLTQLLTLWHQRNTSLWGAGRGSAAAPEPPSLDRCCKRDELEPRAKTGHEISYNNSPLKQSKAIR